LPPLESCLSRAPGSAAPRAVTALGCDRNPAPKTDTLQRVRIFQYLPEVDAFDVTPEYRELADSLGLSEWNPVVWLGRLFALDNDHGEHWFDNWEAREARRALAERHGLDADRLLVIEPARFHRGSDGPCNSANLRARFWHEVLLSLELSIDLLFDKAREANAQAKASYEAGGLDVGEDYIPDLDARIAAWREAHGVSPLAPGQAVRTDAQNRRH
jgi:hypothetical protein